MARNHQLDGLRGLAALSVAIGHCATRAGGLGPSYTTTLATLDQATPAELGFRALHVIFQADAAVVVFFVLSGYVLTRSLAHATSVAREIPAFALRRALRLLPAAAAAAALCWLVLPPATFRQALGAAFLYDASLNGALWSLQVEVYGSAFVFAMWALGRRAAIPAAALTLAIAWQFHDVAWIHPSYVPFFMAAFALGALIDDVPRWMTSPIVGAGALLAILLSDFLLGHGLASRWCQTVGAFGLVAYVAHRGLALLDWRVIHFLGLVSYPFYLVDNVFLGLIADRLPPGAASPLLLFAAYCGLSLAAAIPMSWFVHAAVERPAVVLWKRARAPRRGDYSSPSIAGMSRASVAPPSF